MLATINGCRVRAEDHKSLRVLLLEYIARVRANEPGCRLIRLLEDQDDPCAVIVYAEFEDERAYQAHLQAAHVADLRVHLHPLMGDTHHKTIYRPIAGEPA